MRRYELLPEAILAVALGIFLVDEPDAATSVRIDDLRGNRGTQFYEVPAGAALDEGPWTLLVWCQTFGVPVANATPA